MTEVAGQTGPTLRFGRLASRSLAVTVVLIALGSPLCAWHTGRPHLSAAAAGAIAALTPLLIVGWLITARAMHRDMVAVGRAFVGIRLAALRLGMALVLLQCARILLAPRGASLVIWFGLLYVILLAVEVAWLADEARRIRREDRE